MLRRCGSWFAQGGHYGNALQAALVRGHEKVVQILLEEDAEASEHYRM